MKKKALVIISVVFFLLQACSLSQVLNKKPAAQAPVPSSTPSIPSTSIPRNTPSPTPETFDPAPELMLVPEDIKKDSVTASAGQTSAPEGFREHFVYPIGGIEGGIGCDDPASEPYFLHSPAIFDALSVDPWGDDRIDTCGWTSGEVVTITITMPDGTQATSQQTYDGYMSVSYRPQMEYGMQLGDYSVSFAGPSGSISLDFSVIRPIAPGMAKINENEYFAFGFDPEEPVFILAYKIIKDSRLIQLVSWKESTTDYRGELLVEDSIPSDLLAVADFTGTLIVWSDPFWPIFIGDKYLYHQVEPCEGAPASRLQTFDVAKVLDGAANNVRSSPSVSADLVGTVAPGAILYVGKQTPVCADGYLWWYVFPFDGVDPTGWTAEGKGTVYWLAPEK